MQSNGAKASVVWVSGSAGKLGSVVTRQLREAGHTVLEADSKGSSPVDLADPVAVARSMAGADAIIHLAAIPSPEGVEPHDLVRNNTMACFNALEQASRAGIRTAVLASSGSIYGTAWSPEPIAYDEVPVTEATPLAFVDPYALTKDFTERMGQMYARRGMAVTALRFHWIISASEARAVADSHADDEQVRNLWGYVDIEDAARACLLALQPRPAHRGYEAVLIASDETLSTSPTAQLLDRYLPGTQLNRSVTGYDGLFDTALAETVIGWRPTRSWR